MPTLYKYVALPLQLVNDPRLAAADVAVAALWLSWSRDDAGVFNLAHTARRIRLLQPEVEAALDRLVRAGYLVVKYTLRSKNGEPMVQVGWTIPCDRTPQYIGGAS